MSRRCKGYLKTSEDVTSGIGKRFALLQRDTRREPVPVFSDESSEIKQDLLALQETSLLPLREGSAGTGDGGTKLIISTLWHAGQEAVGCRIVQVNPFGGGRRDEPVVDEIGSLVWVVELVMRGDMRRDTTCAGQTERAHSCTSRRRRPRMCASL
jgi:hypothetical protein